MKKILLAILLLGLVAACASNGDPKAISYRSLGSACIAATGAMNVLTPMKAQGKLSTTQEQVINLAVETLNPICSSGDIPSYDYALRTLNTQVWVLNSMILEATGGN